MHSNRFLFFVLAFAVVIMSLAAFLDSPASTRAQAIGPTATASATSTPGSADTYLSLIQRAPNPTATPTPQPECNAYFDDFSDPNSGWGSRDHPVYRRDYINGEYQIYVKEADYIILVQSPANANATYTVEADLRWSGDIGLSYGLLFGLTEDGSFYLFEINSPTQQYAVSYWTANQAPQLVTNGASEAIQTGNNVNHLSVTTNGGQQSYYINDTFVTSTNVNDSGARFTGISASAYPDEGNVDARFDNYCVTTPTGTQSQVGRPNIPPLLELRDAHSVFPR